jgi:peptidoglycan/xylan/chitin deacetylase (PgdA/CDA1 family)
VRRATRLCAISVDLDSLAHYCRIQGLSPDILGTRARALIGAVAIPRLLELLHDAGASATFFVIGSDLDDESTALALRSAAQAGFELANHGFAHDYRLARASPQAIAADMAECDVAIRSQCGQSPVGFRAPGYTLTSGLLRAAVDRGYRYDSSAFPAIPYYLGKAAVMAVLAGLGRPSGAILDSPSVLFAPTSPYRPSLDAPYRVGRAGLVELPIAVAPFSRIPFIGTFATAMPWPLVEATFRSLRSAPFFNFELHAIDVLDVSDGIPEVLARQQRDVLIPVREKLRRLGKIFEWMRADREYVTLAQAAQVYEAVL